MAAESLALVLHYLRTRLGSADTVAVSDGQLLERFVRCGDRTAFEALLRRHGPMVWRVCGRLLARGHDVEDAFQATFLVLLRKARSIRKQRSVASWLYGVAIRVALRARANARRQRALDLSVVAAPADVPSEVSAREVRAIVDGELAQLPEWLRAPLVLCCLEGHSRAEAARQLGWPEGTVASRLARARQRLRGRLARRGVLVSASALAGLLERETAAMPIRLVTMAVRAAGLYSLGETIAPPTVATPVMTLVKEVLQVMLLSKLKVGAALALTCGILVAGVGLAVQQTRGANGLAALYADGSTSVAGALAATDEKASVEQERVPKSPVKPSGVREAVAAQPALTDFPDPLPLGAVARLGTLHFRHEGEARSLVFSRNGKLLAARSDNGVIVIWDILTGIPLQRFASMAQDGRMDRSTLDRMIDFSPDGTLLAGRSWRNLIGIWDTRTGKLQREIVADRDCYTIHFSPDSKFLAVAGGFHSYVLEVATGKPLYDFDEPIGGMAFSPDGTTVVVQVFAGLKARGTGPPREPRELGGPSELQVCSLRKRQVLCRQQMPVGPSGGTSCVIAFTPDGKTMATSWTDSILLWDAAACTVLRSIGTNLGPVKNLAFTPDGNRLISAGETDGKIRIWDVGTGQEQRHVATGLTVLRSMALSSDGKTIAVGSRESTIRLWELASGKELFSELPGHDGQVRTVSYSPDGRLLASVGSDGHVRIWDTATGKPLRTIRGRIAWLVAFSPKGQHLAVLSRLTDHLCGGKDLQIYEVATGKELLHWSAEDTDEINALAFAPDGKALVTAGHKYTERPGGHTFGTVSVWDGRTGRRLHHATLEQDQPHALAFEPNGRLVVLVAGYDRQSVKVRLVHLDTGAETPAVPTLYIGKSVALSPDRRMLLAGNAQRPFSVLRLWEVATGKEIVIFERQLQQLAGVAFSPDGRMVAAIDDGACIPASAQERPGIWLLDAATGKEIQHLQEYASTATCLAFSPSSSQLATGLQNGTVLLWDITGAPRLPRPEQAVKESKSWEALWSDLADEDVSKAYLAIHTLSASPAQAAPFLAARLRPVEEIDRARVERLITELDSNTFAVRTAAAKELAKLGELAEPALRRALESKPTLEARMRLERLRAGAWGTPSAETMRTLRAIQVLERIATPEANQLLRQIAAGAEGARETRDARETLERLAKRKSP